MQDWEGQTRYAEYGFFSVSNELNSYKLFLANYSGNAGDSLRYHNNTNFSTMNKDNDKCVDHCASMRKGTFFATKNTENVPFTGVIYSRCNRYLFFPISITFDYFPLSPSRWLLVQLLH